MSESEAGREPAGAAPPRRRRSWLTLVPLGVFAVLAAIFLLRIQEISGGDTSFIPSALIGAPAPEFTLAPLAGLVSPDGTPVPGVARGDLIGKVTLVNVWASWCGPCRLEHPILEELAKDGRFQLVGINYKDRPEAGLGFLGEFGNPFARVGVDERGRAAIDWGVYGVPETFLVGPDGVIRFKVVGPLSVEKVRAELMPQIETLLAPAGQPG